MLIVYQILQSSMLIVNQILQFGILIVLNGHNLIYILSFL